MDTVLGDLVASVRRRRVEVVDRIVENMCSEIPAYAALDRDGLTATVFPTLALILDVLEQRRPLSTEELRVLAAHGEFRGNQGIQLPDMFGAWRIAVRVVIDDLVSEGRDSGADETALLDVALTVHSSTDAAIDAMSRGHHAAELEVARQDQHHRAELVRGILFGMLGAGEIRIHTDRYGLDPDRRYCAVRARPSDALSLADLEKHLDVGMIGGRPRGVAARIDGDLAGFVAEPPTEIKGAVIGVGPLAELSDMAHSFRVASRAMTTALAFGMSGAFDLRGLGLLPAVLADTEIGDGLVERYIAPLGPGDNAQVIVDTVRRYFLTKQRADLTAQAMHLHTNTVRYRLRRFEELANVDLGDLDQALEVWWALQRIRAASATDS